MIIELLNGSMHINIEYDPSDSEYDDNICLCFHEPCQDDEKVFRFNETHLYLTPAEARKLAQALLAVAEHSDYESHDTQDNQQKES